MTSKFSLLDESPVIFKPSRSERATAKLGYTGKCGPPLKIALIHLKKCLNNEFNTHVWQYNGLCLYVLCFIMSHIFGLQFLVILTFNLFNFAEPECRISHQEKPLRRVPQLKQPHSPFSSLYTTRIDSKNTFKTARKTRNTEGKHITLPGKILNLSHPSVTVPPTEAVARLLEHEALTALPKATFNLFQWNGIWDVWWISHCL